VKLDPINEMLLILYLSVIDSFIVDDLWLRRWYWLCFGYPCVLWI